MTNDRVIVAKKMYTSLTITLRGKSASRPPDQIGNVIQNTQEQISQRKFPTRQKYTPLGEPIESVFKQLLQHNVIKLPDAKPYDPGQFKPSW